MNAVLLREYFGGTLRASASQLEAFAACPFKHFAGYVLRPSEMMRPELESFDAGNFAHAVLARFTKLLREKDQLGLPMSDHALEAAYEGAAESPRRQMERTGLLAQPTSKLRIELLENELRMLARWLVTAFEQLSLLPVLEEVAVGSGDFAAMTLGGMPEGWTATVRGRIDRVDVRGGLFVVVDYKLRRKKVDWSGWESGQSLQLPLYLLLARNGCPSLAGLKPAGGFYLEIVGEEQTEEDSAEELAVARRYRGVAKAGLYNELLGDVSWSKTPFVEGCSGDPEEKPRRSGTAVSEAEFSALLDQTALLAERTAHAIASGDVRVFPANSGSFTACSHCGYQPFCGIDFSLNRANQIVRRSRASVLTSLTGGGHE